MIVMVNRQARRYDELITYFNRLSDFLFVLAWMSRKSCLSWKTQFTK